MRRTGSASRAVTPPRSLSVGLALATLAPAPIATGILAATLLVGVSRCDLGVHYPGDVIGGWLFGVARFSLGVRI